MTVLEEDGMWISVLPKEHVPTRMFTDEEWVPLLKYGSFIHELKLWDDGPRARTSGWIPFGNLLSAFASYFDTRSLFPLLQSLYLQVPAAIDSVHGVVNLPQNIWLSTYFASTHFSLYRYRLCFIQLTHPMPCDRWF